MTDLANRLVVCRLEKCLGLQKEWQSSDIAAAKLFKMMGGRLVLETEKSPQFAKKYWDELELDTPVLAWQGNWLYTYISGSICGGNALPHKEMRGLVKDLLEAFPAVGVAVLSQSGEMYLPRANRFAHACLKEEKTPYVLSELDSIPAPWYKITLYAEPVIFRKVRMYLAEKTFQDYKWEQKDVRLAFYSRALGRQYAAERLWQITKTKAENTLWLGCSGVSSGDAQAQVLQVAHPGCLGEVLYSLCKG